MTPSDKLMNDLARVLTGKDIDLVAPALVVAVARVLMIEAGNDPHELSRLMLKFVRLLGDTLSEMGAEEGLGEPRN